MKKSIVRKMSGSLSPKKRLPSDKSPVSSHKGNQGGISIHWFRKGLRLHDNPGLVEATK